MEKGPLAPFLWPLTVGPQGPQQGTAPGSQYDMSAASYYRLADKCISWQTWIAKVRPLNNGVVDDEDELEGLFK